MVKTGKSELINQEKSTNFLHQKRNVAAMGSSGFCLPSLTYDPTTVKDLWRTPARASLQSISGLPEQQQPIRNILTQGHLLFIMWQCSHMGHDKRYEVCVAQYCFFTTPKLAFTIFQNKITVIAERNSTKALSCSQTNMRGFWPNQSKWFQCVCFSDTFTWHWYHPTTSEHSSYSSILNCAGQILGYRVQ